ncbi:glycine--tRNA ligase subunit beta [Sphingomonas sp.]|uniref:glycine--tRNA ligase subunit beta n=1 Tax=Sphingomonas sp. TaxID=28214 RepID=UPI003751D123
MSDFLLELLSEEIPARMQARARNDLARMFAEALAKAGLAHGGVTTWSTPRRLVLIARDVPGETLAVREEVKGPRSSAPPQALEGFLRKTGLAREQLEERDGVFFAVIDQPGRVAVEVLGEAVAGIVRDFPWPKSMRWGAASTSMTALRWVRPLHSIVALLGDAIVPVAIEGVTCGATTMGHRFHHPGPITIGGASDYAEKLRACHVIVDHEEREVIIRKGAKAAAEAAGYALVEDEGLVVENAGLTEWPVPLLGTFDADYLDVPPEVIQLTARTNQKYFVMRTDEGALAPAFVCTANIAANDGGKSIVEGNRRVLAARLSDARFFWEQDVKVPLEEQAKKLSGIVFHEKLGTVADKVERVAKLAWWLVKKGIVKGADPADAERAARLCKADLVTGMVGEFPELQGVIGGYLAAAQGENKAVSDAVRDHYKPVGQGDEVPTAPVTVAVSLADKLDTLVGFFTIKEKPSGSKDPFALRRAMLGIIDLITENMIRKGVRQLVSEGYRIFADQLCEQRYVLSQNVDDPSVGSAILRGEAAYLPLGKELVVLKEEPPISLCELSGGKSVWCTSDMRRHELIDFEALGYLDVVNTLTESFFDRLRDREKRLGRRPDLISAVLPINWSDILEGLGIGSHMMTMPNTTANDDIIRILSLGSSLQALIESSEGTDLLAAYKRAANILKKEGWAVDGERPLSPLAFGESPSPARGEGSLPAEESALVAALDGAEPRVVTAIEAEDFAGAMGALASLRAPIDAFFEGVTVNDADPAVRARRLNLLARFRDAVHQVADFSKIEG